MRIIQEPKQVALEINGILKRKKNGECAACLKKSVRIFVEKIYEMGFWRVAVCPSYI
jgi:hypothetical protein